MLPLASPFVTSDRPKIPTFVSKSHPCIPGHTRSPVCPASISVSSPGGRFGALVGLTVLRQMGGSFGQSQWQTLGARRPCQHVRPSDSRQGMGRPSLRCLAGGSSGDRVLQAKGTPAPVAHGCELKPPFSVEIGSIRGQLPGAMTHSQRTGDQLGSGLPNGLKACWTVIFNYGLVRSFL